mmetsp:Transcript_17752/g.38905  ORF Transcript_17752/g.38905 Transcript_17752/m.38905 type:complete len:102 (-) Transcript_17752:2545-2850(-)
MVKSPLERLPVGPSARSLEQQRRRPSELQCWPDGQQPHVAASRPMQPQLNEVRRPMAVGFRAAVSVRRQRLGDTYAALWAPKWEHWTASPAACSTAALRRT